MPNGHWFAQASRLAAFAGLAPGEGRSGTSLRRKGKLVKWGNTHLRSVFDNARALCSSVGTLSLLPLRERLLAKNQSESDGQYSRDRRKLLHLCYGVLKTGKPFDPNHAIQGQI